MEQQAERDPHADFQAGRLPSGEPHPSPAPGLPALATRSFSPPPPPPPCQILSALLLAVRRARKGPASPVPKRRPTLSLHRVRGRRLQLLLLRLLLRLQQQAEAPCSFCRCETLRMDARAWPGHPRTGFSVLGACDAELAGRLATWWAVVTPAGPGSAFFWAAQAEIQQVYHLFAPYHSLPVPGKC
ncbi:Hypothetical predicted protein [Podarcis lilfordi]|uniref:Uncharacterized protein n=1 Tax=Podarcis lilfordi TaxID=74358 RepID=A0AA35KJL6_9SAUR|nr:Hypothetical predicted protein [Podarcis lilfordi]